ncbi:3',5'-cyclic-nucleotide phosphodiesterase [Rheinheimera riviphila]|uniref:3',5'-cyclic-nucleotide phosphodiesterase n=1 Tax=Rheinheimera riviphila TaxID=1834037 RepID=A0A437QF28_9GAMM|nr:metallophosphoesterase [Rheinheimera riviphila]RVU33157.1 3',5'-cyclic-nucleotide phosphodiesterase [Rheinheimera riviphila]
MSAPYLFATKAHYRLLQLTDCHLLADPQADYQQIKPYQHLAALLGALKTQAFDALLLTGDLTQDHSLASYQLLADLLKDWPSPVFYLPGNHDEPDLMAQAFAKPPFVAATEVTANGWTWLLLNTKGATPAGEFDQPRLLELATTLQNTRTPVWLFCHHHPLPIGAAIDRHGLQHPEALLSLLTEHPQVKGLAHGHCHSAYQATHQIGYQAGHPAGLTIVGCPATSVQFTLSADWQTEDQGPQGCVWNFAADGSVHWEFIRL